MGIAPTGKQVTVGMTYYQSMTHMNGWYDLKSETEVFPLVAFYVIMVLSAHKLWRDRPVVATIN